MLQLLTKVGNSNAILLDQTIMSLIGLDEKSQVDLTVRGGSLVITPVNPTIDPQKFEAATERAMKKYDKLLTRLA